jgi:hypothetical protein
MLLRTPGYDYVAVREPRLNARKIGTELVCVPHGDV